MSTPQLTASTVVAMLVYLGVEPSEGSNPGEVLDDTLANYNLTRDQFATKETCFALGYHRGMASRQFSEDQAPSIENGEDGAQADGDMLQAIEDGYGYGLESRDLKLSPPPSLVFQAHEAGDLEAGDMASWADNLDLSTGHRLGQAITVGSGKDAQTIPAGTPVDILNDSVDKDGVNHVLVLYDGSALIVPNPEDSPRVVSGDTQIAPAKKTRKRAAGAKKKGEPKERGPSLKDAIIHVMEGKDGGPGPLQTNGQFANRVLKQCRVIGIGEKAGSFVQKADRHVPYYINCYKPNSKDNTPGRLGLRNPLAWVCAAAEARKYYLRADGNATERLASVPDEIKARMEDREAKLETAEPPAPPAKSDDDKEKGGKKGGKKDKSKDKSKDK